MFAEQKKKKTINFLNRIGLRYSLLSNATVSHYICGTVEKFAMQQWSLSNEDYHKNDTFSSGVDWFGNGKGMGTLNHSAIYRHFG